jgi:hypothetical protein
LGGVGAEAPKTIDNSVVIVEEWLTPPF